MGYILESGKIKKKFEDEMKNIIQNGKYSIQRMESFAGFLDPLFPFKECMALPGTAFSPISFSECEDRCRTLGPDHLAKNRESYNNRKAKWAKTHCTKKDVKNEEEFQMIKDIQYATLPGGAFSMAFHAGRKPGMDEEYAPLLYKPLKKSDKMLDSFCNAFANGDAFQMNVYCDNLLNESSIDELYPFLVELMEKYNQYAFELYMAFRNDRAYQRRMDF